MLALALVGSVRVDAAEAERPNVLLLCVDDLKPLLGCYGDRTVRTPHMDRLAMRGLRFDRAYCNQAVCAPSRNALLTGIRPTTSGIYDLGTHFRDVVPDAVTLPQYFRQHGYRTEALGKVFHVGHGNREDPASWSVPHFPERSIAYVTRESGALEGLTREEALFANRAARGLPRGAAWEAADVADDEYPDGRIAAEAVRRLEAAAGKGKLPFFMAVGFLKPHLPFCAPKRYWDLYVRQRFELPALRGAPEGAPHHAPSGWGELRQYRGIPESGPVDDETARTLIHGYHASVSYVDAQIGRVLDALERLDLASRTLVVLWGDHGWHLGDHGLWSKHDNYEEAARIPLIVAVPGVTVPGGRATRALVETVDLYPTLAELAGLPPPVVPQGMDGRSFAAVLRDPSRPARDFVTHVFPRGERLGRAIRTPQHRLVEWKLPGASPETAEIELYDFDADPLETRNLATDQPATVARLRAHLDTLPEARPQFRR
ncbi:MAG: sulfatase [Verrucomicrobia bacterium]|nr:sulfatase [Verrucomicrobiota bacterium]